MGVCTAAAACLSSHVPHPLLLLLLLQVIEAELGVPWGAVFSSLSASPVAAASLGQVYKGTLASNGAEVAVKVGCWLS
jgi:predicted unusual protein kinase regulating ubiquinone biosynthesis (AarF/ABC1/UbiB family)